MSLTLLLQQFFLGRTRSQSVHRARNHNALAWRDRSPEEYNAFFDCVDDNKPHPKIRNDEFKDLVETIGKKGMGYCSTYSGGKKGLEYTWVDCIAW